jgi:hypothetical protein
MYDTLPDRSASFLCVITIEDDDGYGLLTGATKAICGDVVYDGNGVEGQLGHETMARSCH